MPGTPCMPCTAQSFAAPRRKSSPSGQIITFSDSNQICFVVPLVSEKLHFCRLSLRGRMVLGEGNIIEAWGKARFSESPTRQHVVPSKKYQHRWKSHRFPHIYIYIIYTVVVFGWQTLPMLTAQILLNLPFSGEVFLDFPFPFHENWRCWPILGQASGSDLCRQDWADWVCTDLKVRTGRIPRLGKHGKKDSQLLTVIFHCQA